MGTFTARHIQPARTTRPQHPWQSPALVALACLSTVASPALAQTQRAPRVAPQMASPEPVDPTPLTRAQTLDRLSVTLEVDFEGQSLHDVVRYLSLVANVPLDPFWQDGLTQPGLDPMLSITLDARGRSALECLERILALASEQQRFDTPATWQFSPTGTIEFGPRERLNRPAALRAEVYDVADLLAAIQPPAAAPRLTPSTSILGGTGPWVFPGDEGAPPETGVLKPQSPTDRLIDVITTTVEPEQWVINGGDVGIIKIHDGALIVLAPDYVHRGLVGPLDQAMIDLQTESE